MLVLVLHADLFVDDSVVDDIQAPRWRDRADTAAGRDFAAALDEAYAHSLPVHPYLRLQRGAGRFVFVRYCNNRGRPIVGRLALWNGRQYRVELGDF
ncbi:hypothetical protein [Paraburkholderia sp. J76]|uniref:hypothetical protein n=1 Tax=Paraburkholderia sp. J76 TaxID=2805439 RepID=UPI002ABDB7E1|nr:hypothetical protein [Paraburkholderia sp. J76]